MLLAIVDESASIQRFSAENSYGTSIPAGLENRMTTKLSSAAGM